MTTSFRFLIAIIVCHWVPTASHAQDKDAPYEIAVQRNGAKIPALAVPFWSGEYPLPVINVSATKQGTTKIKALASLREMNKSVECTIKNGIYHPWSKTEHSAELFYSLTELVHYEAVEAVTFENIAFKKGDRIVRVVYLSEGLCSGVPIQTNKKRPKKEGSSKLEFSCDLADTNKSFKKSATADSTKAISEQWILLKCLEGHKAFIQDVQFLKLPNVTEGKVKTFGNVEP